ncbi:MAG: hypothetical protein RBS56_02660 [Candidatus Gracilibacteria bacterium]|jgi:hypothetical protein|nr:hypothetical protein [Candidatus Gracilibacteria bacterium]
MQEKSFLFGISTFALVLVLGLCAYSFYQKTSLSTQIEKLNFEYEELSNQYSQSGFADTLSLASAKNIISKLDESSLKWSEVIKEINKTVPKDTKNNSRLDIVAYSGAGGSSLTLNVSTLPDSENPFFDVADFIKAFDSSTKFKDNFVPSISSGVTAEGREILSFSFSTTYVEEVPLLSR